MIAYIYKKIFKYLLVGRKILEIKTIMNCTKFVIYKSSKSCKNISAR